VYSRTVSYAGSLWNIYIQKVRSAKNVQLGVYLHRAKDRETDEPAHGNSLSQQNNGSVDERIGQLEREMLMRSERRDVRRSARNTKPPTRIRVVAAAISTLHSHATLSFQAAVGVGMLTLLAYLHGTRR
jgi:hypothetical protein